MLTEPLSCSTHTKCSTKGNQTNEFKKINNSKAKRHGAFHVFLSRISGTFVVNTSAVHMITIYWIKPRVVSVVWSSTLLPYLMQMKCWTSMPICNTVFRYKYIEQIKLSSSGYLSEFGFWGYEQGFRQLLRSVCDWNVGFMVADDLRETANAEHGGTERNRV